MPLNEKEKLQILQILEQQLLLNKFQRERFLSTLDRMLSLFKYRNGFNVLSKEGIARWEIHMPQGPAIPPILPPGGSAIPINQVVRMAA